MRVGASQDLLNFSASMIIILCNFKDGYRGFGHELQNALIKNCNPALSIQLTQ
jgi:hypothetical protein